ncbi:MAG: hypothetical protein ACK56F_02785, partial [bacterium]
RITECSICRGDRATDTAHRSNKIGSAPSIIRRTCCCNLVGSAGKPHIRGLLVPSENNASAPSADQRGSVSCWTCGWIRVVWAFVRSYGISPNGNSSRSVRQQ